MVDKVVSALASGGQKTTTIMSNITPAPPTGSSHDLSESDFIIGDIAYGSSPSNANVKVTKTFTVFGELTANVRVYGASGNPQGPDGGGGTGRHGGAGGRIAGDYTFKPGQTYVLMTGGGGGTGGFDGEGGGGASAVTFAPIQAGVEILVAGGGGGGGYISAGLPGSGGPNAGAELVGVLAPLAPRAPQSASGTTGGTALPGRKTPEPGGNAPRGRGGSGSGPPYSGSGGGDSDYAQGRAGGSNGDTSGSGGGGGYAGGAGGNNESTGAGGGGGNGYAHPEVKNVAFGRGGTPSNFPGDPVNYGIQGAPPFVPTGTGGGGNSRSGVIKLTLTGL